MTKQPNIKTLDNAVLIAARIPPVLRDRLLESAQRAHRTQSMQVLYILEQYLATEDKFTDAIDS